jgi:rRNA maturation endonuclease Nob1
LNRLDLFQAGGSAHTSIMKKACHDCRTMHNVEAKYCDACGYQFWHDPVRQMWKKRRVTHYGAAIVAGLLVATVRYLILG